MSEIGDKVIELHRSGITKHEIAHRLNVAEATVQYHLCKLAEPPSRALSPVASQRSARSAVRTRERVRELLAGGKSRSDIAAALGITKQTVSYHARRLGADIDHRCARRYEWELVQEFHDQGHGVRECARVFGFSTSSWYEAIQRGVIKPRRPCTPAAEILVQDSRYNRRQVKQRLLRLGLKELRCERCSLSDWRGQPLSLALHHVNGDRHDNRVENLELLCPNCHSQTDTFSGRNGHRPRRLSGIPAPQCPSSQTA